MNELLTEELTTEQPAAIIKPVETKPSRSTQQALRERNKKTKRISLKNQKSLTFEQDPRYRYAEIIDKGGRIDAHIKAGYELVEKPDHTHEGRSKDASNIGKYRNRIVGTTDTGHEIRAYIMRIPKEWYEADQKEKLDYIDKYRDPRKQKIEGVSDKDTRGIITVHDTER